MQNKLFEKAFSFGLLLIIISFNPYLYPGLYLDSTGSFSFISVIKIILLGILDLFVLILWINKIRRTGELAIISTKIYLPVLLFMVSTFTSVIMSINLPLAIFGYNFTLESSLIETILLFFFFLAFINNVKHREELENIIRFTSIGVAIVTIYSLIRFSGTWEIGFRPLSFYLNSNTFTPLGSYSSLVVTSLISLVFTSALFITDIILQRGKIAFFIDSLCLGIIGIGFGVFLNIGSSSPEYLYIALFIIAILGIFYFVFKNNRVQKALIPSLALILLSIGVGIGFHFLITKDSNQPNIPSSVPVDITWGITLDSISSIDKGLIGNGQGTFANSFDLYKSDTIALPYTVNGVTTSNFIINAQSPNTEEVRIFQSPSYLLNILTSQGLFGLISFIAIVGMAVFIGFNKKSLSSNILGLFSFSIFISLSLISITLKYDFIISLFLWLSLAIFVISASEDEPGKNFIIAVTGKSRDFNENWNYLIPGISAVITGIILINAIPILGSNYFGYLAKSAQVDKNTENYQKYSETAANVNPSSDLFLREKAFSKAVTLFEKFESLRNIPPSEINSGQANIATNQAFTLQSDILIDLDRAIRMNTREYKNFYTTGLILATSSEYTNRLNFDAKSADFLQSSIDRNPHHPESYYQLSKIYLRNDQSTAALNRITSAVKMRPQNLLYYELYADILRHSGDYQNALTLYSTLKELRDSNPTNEEIKKFYEEKTIDSDIEESIRKLKEKQNSVSPTIIPTPMITSTPIPTTKRR